MKVKSRKPPGVTGSECERMMVWSCVRGVESDYLTAELSAGLLCCSECQFCPPALVLLVH